MRNTLKRLLRERGGQVLLVAAFALVVVMGVAALTIDVGQMFCAHARLQNAADAAALAAGQKMVLQRNDGSSEESARSAAAAEGQAFVVANWQAAGWQVAFGILQNGQFVAQDDNTPAAAVQVSTYRNDSSPGGPLAMFFAPVFGLDTVEVSATAVCEIAEGISTVRGDISPFTVSEEGLAGLGEIMTIYPNDQYAPGNFGLLNLDGGNFGTNRVANWIRYGYEGEISIVPDTGYIHIGGAPGLRASLQDDVETRVGDTMLLLLHDQVTGQGANTQYRIVEFSAVTFLAVDFHGQDKYITARVERLVQVPNSEHHDSFSDNLAKVQLVR